MRIWKLTPRDRSDPRWKDWDHSNLWADTLATNCADVSEHCDEYSVAGPPANEITEQQFDRLLGQRDSSSDGSRRLLRLSRSLTA